MAIKIWTFLNTPRYTVWSLLLSSALTSALLYWAYHR
jgi:hypothetical protein